MNTSLLLTAIFIIFHHFQIPNIAQKTSLKISISPTLYRGPLNFLLFAGALTIDFNILKAQKLNLPFLYYFLSDALISPTDPISVLATFKQLGAPERLTGLRRGKVVI